MTTPTVSESEYWEELYQRGDTGWDKSAVAPPLARMLRSKILAPGARLLVLGAGRGHDAIEAARLGFETTAVDFAPSAAEALQAGAVSAGVALRVWCRDLFQLLPEDPPFDAVLEHTCLCAIDVSRRPEYVALVHSLLRPSGIYFGLLYAHTKPGGPPYAIHEPEVRSLYSGHFEFDRFVVPPDSFQARAGCEFEVVFRRRN